MYDCDIPESMVSLVPALAALCKKARLSDEVSSRPMSNRSMMLTSMGGTNFISFAKGASFDDGKSGSFMVCGGSLGGSSIKDSPSSVSAPSDLYHGWVAPALQSDLLVQFWIRSTGILPSDCSLGWKVLDITLINPGQTFAFKNSQDHSKWAVSPKQAWGGKGGGWVCVGDINRNEAEEKRGGGTVCLQDPVVWKAYRSAALQCEACGGGTMQC